MIGALLVVCILSSGAIAQETIEVAPEADKKPLVTPPKLVRFVEADYPGSEEEEPVEAVVEADSRDKRNADQLGMEVIEMLWEVGVGRLC